MLNLFKLLFVTIHIDQATVLHWFGVGEKTSVSSVNSPFETFRLIIEGLWEKIQIGLTLGDIENILFLIICIRFVILAFRYNPLTSFYITCIGLFAGYLWYRHLIDLISMYRSVLLQIPFLHRLGINAVQLRDFHRQSVLTDVSLGTKSVGTILDVFCILLLQKGLPIQIQLQNFVIILTQFPCLFQN